MCGPNNYVLFLILHGSLEEVLGKLPKGDSMMEKRKAREQSTYRDTPEQTGDSYGYRNQPSPLPSDREDKLLLPGYISLRISPPCLPPARSCSSLLLGLCE